MSAQSGASFGPRWGGSIQTTSLETSPLNYRGGQSSHLLLAKGQFGSQQLAITWVDCPTSGSIWPARCPSAMTDARYSRARWCSSRPEWATRSAMTAPTCSYTSRRPLRLSSPRSRATCSRSGVAREAGAVPREALNGEPSNVQRTAYTDRVRRSAPAAASERAAPCSPSTVISGVQRWPRPMWFGWRGRIRTFDLLIHRTPTISSMLVAVLSVGRTRIQSVQRAIRLNSPDGVR